MSKTLTYSWVTVWFATMACWVTSIGSSHPGWGWTCFAVMAVVGICMAVLTYKAGRKVNNV